MEITIINMLAAVWLVILGTILYNDLVALPKKIKEKRPLPMEDYIYKVARIAGKSEYDVFCKSAEDWPVSTARIEQDFKRYLCNQSVPYYVNNFIRKNKSHIDELRFPLI